jgi:hypothetical protein
MQKWPAARRWGEFPRGTMAELRLFGGSFRLSTSTALRAEHEYEYEGTKGMKRLDGVSPHPGFAFCWNAPDPQENRKPRLTPGACSAYSAPF